MSSDERVRLLAELDAALKANPLLRYNNPDLSDKIHHKQLAFHGAETRVKVFTGGTRSGKSSSGVVDDLIQLLPKEWVPPHLIAFKRKDPPFKLRIITPDLGHTMSAVLDGLRNWCPPAALRGGSWDTAYDKTKRLLHFTCGSRVDFMSFETDLDKFGGVALDRVHLDEEPPGEKGEAIYKQSLRRLVDYQGDLLLTATPEFGLSWTSTEFWDERGPEVEERVWQNDWLTIVRATTGDNPFVPDDELSEKQMTEEEYRRTVLGEWVHPQGLVFPEFREQADEKGPAHVVPEPAIDHVRSLDNYVGIDPGIRTSGIVFCGFDRDNVMLVWDELYLHDDAAVPANSAQLIKQKLADKGLKVEDVRFIIDPSARNRSLVNADDVQSAFYREDIPCTPGQNTVEAGVFELKRRMQSDPPGIFVSATCENWLNERRRYRLETKPDGTFGVLKREDHVIDPTRYVAQERAWHLPPAPTQRRNPTFVPDFQPPLTTERSIKETPPQGAFT